MLTTIATEIGYLSEKQVVAFRRAITLDMEIRKEGTEEKTKLTVQACEDTLRTLTDDVG